jgi:hypothetical protein
MKYALTVLLGCIAAGTGLGAVMLEVDSRDPMRANLVGDMDLSSMFFVAVSGGEVSATAMPCVLIYDIDDCPPGMVCIDPAMLPPFEHPWGQLFVVEPDPECILHPGWPPGGLLGYFESLGQEADLELLDGDTLEVISSVHLMSDPMSCYTGPDQYEYKQYREAGYTEEQMACWCNPYQCYGDVDGEPQTWFRFYVYIDDLDEITRNWKKKLSDPTLNPCADVDHRRESLFQYRVFIGDLNRLIENWKLKAGQKEECISPL